MVPNLFILPAYRSWIVFRATRSPPPKKKAPNNPCPQSKSSLLPEWVHSHFHTQWYYSGNICHCVDLYRIVLPQDSSSKPATNARDLPWQHCWCRKPRQRIEMQADMSLAAKPHTAREWDGQDGLTMAFALWEWGIFHDTAGADWVTGMPPHHEATKLILYPLDTWKSRRQASS